MDIDTITSVKDLEEAIRKAREETKLDIPLTMASVSEVPYEYESRLEEVPLPGIKRLKIRVPEKHDWALMKTARCNAKDIEDIREVKDAVGLDVDVLLERFVTEMIHIEPQDQEGELWLSVIHIGMFSCRP